MSISSHVVLPKVVLRNFEPAKGDHFYWIEYSSAPEYLIKRGYAATFNTQEGYYTEEAEKYLNKNIENHINSLLKKVPDINDVYFISDEKTKDVSFSYLETLFARDPSIHMEQEESPSEIVMFLSPKLKDSGTIRDKFSNVSLFINQSKVPLVLPSNGIIQLNDKIICPLSPHVALFFYNSTENYYVFEDKDDCVMDINRIAFRQAISHNCSALICNDKNILCTLKEEYLSKKQ